jgi:hypothetical protein
LSHHLTLLSLLLSLLLLLLLLLLCNWLTGS